MNTESKKIVILGAGPTGLGAAYQLNKLGYQNWSIFERAHQVGGLSSSFLDEQGFTWDVGGHVLFSHYEYFSKAVEEALNGAYYEHLRESWIRILGVWVPYPFQNNIRHLPASALSECIKGLRNNSLNPSSAIHFRDWLEAVFGRGIVKYFMEPYNRKVWGVPLDTMSKDWIHDRVSVVDASRIEKNIAEGKDDVNWGPNNRFRFPTQGGTGAIFKGLARSFQNDVRLNHHVERILPKSKEILFSNGARMRYDVLITTIPLDEFVNKCDNIPEQVLASSRRLVHNSGLIIGLGFRGKRSDPRCWMYFPENNCPFYRVTNFHNYSPHNVPGGDAGSYFSLMCETTYSFYRPIDKQTIAEQTIAGLIAAGMITKTDSADIVSKYIIDIPYSYPVPTIGRDADLARIQAYLELHNIYSRGRFGAWKYEIGNMDHSFMQGVEVVERIVSGKPELTINGKTA